jgi:hypothetical protein
LTTYDKNGNKLKEHCQKQMVISGEKAVQQLEELLVLMINSFEGVKDVIKFMSFEELEIVGFQTKTKIENENQDKSIEGVVSEKNEEKPIELLDETPQKEETKQPTDVNEFSKMYNETK